MKRHNVIYVDRGSLLKEDEDIRDKVERVLRDFDLEEEENFKDALDAVIGMVDEDQFSDLEIIKIVVEILDSQH